MKHWFRGAKRRPDGTLEMNLHSRVLEDDTTLFIMQVIDKDTEDIPPSPLAELVSFFVLQPRRDIKAAAETGAIVTAEEHLEHGGLGSEVAVRVARHQPVPMELIALKDTYAKSGKPGELLQRYGLTAGDIEQAVRSVAGKKKPG